LRLDLVSPAESLTKSLYGLRSITRRIVLLKPASALRTDLQVWVGMLDDVASAQVKTLGSNGAHNVQFSQKLTIASLQKSVYI